MSRSKAIKKILAQQDSVGQILDSTANKYLIRLSTRKVNHILFNQANILMRFSHHNNMKFIRYTEKDFFFYSFINNTNNVNITYSNNIII